eukprot:72594_1
MSTPNPSFIMVQSCRFGCGAMEMADGKRHHHANNRCPSQRSRNGQHEYQSMEEQRIYATARANSIFNRSAQPGALRQRQHTHHANRPSQSDSQHQSQSNSANTHHRYRKPTKKGPDSATSGNSEGRRFIWICITCGADNNVSEHHCTTETCGMERNSNCLEFETIPDGNEAWNEEEKDSKHVQSDMKENPSSEPMDVEILCQTPHCGFHASQRSHLGMYCSVCVKAVPVADPLQEPMDSEIQNAEEILRMCQNNGCDFWSSANSEFCSGCGGNALL